MKKIFGLTASIAFWALLMTSVAVSSCSSDDDDDSNTTNNVVEKSYTSFDSIPWNRKSDSISVKAGNKIAYNYGRGTSLWCD